MLWNHTPVLLTVEHVTEIMDIQREVMETITNPRWYFTSEADVFADEVRGGHALGIRAEDGTLAAVSICRLGEHRDNCYARLLGLDPAGVMDFEDMLVRPAFRRQGIHSLMTDTQAAEARALGCHLMLCTVDPENIPCRRSIEKSGFTKRAEMNLYDGRPRCVYGMEI